MQMIKDVRIESGNEIHVVIGDELFDALKRHRVLQARELVYKIIWQYPSLNGEGTELSELPKDLLQVPLILNLAPIVWRLGLKVEIERLESVFAQSLGELYLSYRRLWKELPWSGKIEVLELTANNEEGFSEDGASLFSFGVDSVATFIRHKAHIKSLISIVGADVDCSDQDGANEFKTQSQLVSQRFGVRSIGIQSNLKDILNYSALSKLIPQWTDWWTNFQHGPSLVAYLLIVAYAFKCKNAYIAASDHTDYLARLGSRPDLEGILKYGSVSVIHDGTDMLRQQKVALIGKEWNEPLHVCWKAKSFKNCGCCEKCIRTILAFLVEGDLESISRYFLGSPDYEQIKKYVIKLFSKDYLFDWGDVGEYEGIKKFLLTDEQYRKQYLFTETQMEIIRILRDFVPYEKFCEDLMKQYAKERGFFSIKKNNFHASW